MKEQDRIVALIDMDCFYVQVEERDYPAIKNVPAAVVQYNSWKGGGIIAVNYEARELGVKRGMRGDDAKEKCPSIKLVQVPVLRGKADLAKYRNAGREVITVLSEFSDCVERASVDEAYIELTGSVKKMIKSQEYNITTSDFPDTWVVPTGDSSSPTSKDRLKYLNEWISTTLPQENSEDMFVAFTPEKSDECQLNLQLLLAAQLIKNIRKAVLEKTGFKCSAGISYNKMLSKLACGLHKPNQQTVLPRSAVPHLWSTMPVGKVRLLGGKLGYCLTEDFKCKTMAQLAALPVGKLKEKFDEKTVLWLEGLGRGEDPEPVRPRQLPKSIGCSKNFTGNDYLATEEKMITWITNLTEELSERLDEDSQANCRRARTLTISIHIDSDSQIPSFSKSAALLSTKCDRLADLVRTVLNSTDAAKKLNWFQSVRVMGLSAGKFEDSTASGTKSIQDMFKKTEKLPRIQLSERTSLNSSASFCKAANSLSSIVQFAKDSTESRCGKKSFFKRYREKHDQENDIEQEIMEGVEGDDQQVELTLEENRPGSAMEGQNQGGPEEELEANENPEDDRTNLEVLVNQLNENSEESAPQETTIVAELFLDLDSVDQSVLQILPQNVKILVEEALEKHLQSKGFSSSLITKCVECGKPVKTEKLPEHMDYHMAVKLRMEQMQQTRNQLNISSPKKPQSKRGRKAKEQKGPSKMQKIAHYFKK